MKKKLIKKGLLLLCCCSLFLENLPAQHILQEQVSKTDSAALFVYTDVEFSYNFSLADLKKEFGNFMAVGAGVHVKTKSNWLLGFTFNYQFSGKVRQDVVDEMFQYIMSPGTAYFISSSGLATENVSVDYRGLNFILTAGKIIPVVKRFQNSGILLKVGLGVNQHYIFIKNPDNEVLQLNEDYRKGYDRLTLGYSLYEFIGYQHMTKKNLLCFFGGIEFQQTFSHRQRVWDFSLMKKDDRHFFEGLIGLKIGWIIPLYKHNPYRVFQSRF